MKKLALLCVLCCSAVCSFSQGQYRDEFNGPYASWANVKLRFKASGNGVKDDTRALQVALDSLSCTERVLYNTDPATRYVVIYLPAGTYRITQTLHLTGKIGVTFVGEDPEKTIIKWEGKDNDTMFNSNRSSYVKLSRITWDANNKKGIYVIGFHYKDFNEPNFAPTTIELSDMIFKGKPLLGISGGTFSSDGTNMMDAEFTIKRCRFYACTFAGIFIKGYNALDYWIWDCVFNNCDVGVYSIFGNYHIYQSHFNHSLSADIYVKNSPYSSVRGCYSNNGKAFSIDEGASCNTFKRIFQGNVVRNCKSTPIQYHHQGKITLMDNYFINDNKVENITVDYNSWCPGNYDVLSVYNSYPAASPHNLSKDRPSKIHSISDKKFNLATTKIPAAKPVQPFLPMITRKVFEVPAQAGSRVIQDMINKAAALKGQRAVVHFPMGTFNINQTLEVPPGSDIQLIGDGILHASILKKSGNKERDAYLIKVNGPSFVTIKDLQVEQDDAGSNGILFKGIDQSNSQVRFDQITSSSATTLFIDKLDYTYFEKNNSFFAKGHIILGGDKVKSGTGTSRLYCFGGQSAGVRLENNATMVAKDCWWEGEYRKNFIPLNLSGYGNLTVDGAMYAPTDNDSGTVVNVTKFKGNISLMNMFITGGIDVKTDSPELNMLIWNISHYHKKDPRLFLKNRTSAKIAMIGITSQCIPTAAVPCSIGDPQSLPDVIVNVPDLNTFIHQLTTENRKAMPAPFVNLSAGISNIYISRVTTSNGKNAYTFQK